MHRIYILTGAAVVMEANFWLSCAAVRNSLKCGYLYFLLLHDNKITKQTYECAIKYVSEFTHCAKRQTTKT